MAEGEGRKDKGGFWRYIVKIPGSGDFGRLRKHRILVQNGLYNLSA